MSKSTSIIVIVIIVMLGVAGFLYFKNNGKTGANLENTENNLSVEERDLVKPVNSEIIISTSTDTTIKSYALAEISMHNTQTDCWSIVNGSVYDLTSWIKLHPGGEKAIMSICGKNGSNAFNAKHGEQKAPKDQLAKFKIGELK